MVITADAPADFTGDERPPSASPASPTDEYEEYRALRREFIARIPTWPGADAARGIVICGGGEKYLPGVWVLVNELKALGCKLPVQIWYLGPVEMPPDWERRLESLGVMCIDAQEVRSVHPARILNGWEVKPFAMLHCPFGEVLLLDADNMPVRDPEFLFETREYVEYGAIFWPDLGRLAPDRDIWKICDLAWRDEPEFESGQIVVNKERCWRELNLAMHLNEYSDFYYRHIHGDKDTFHMAWRMLGTDYAMTPHGVLRLNGILCQHDFDGDRLFQHRAGSRKWTLTGNPPIHGFINWTRCVSHLRKLEEAPDPVPRAAPGAAVPEIIHLTALAGESDIPGIQHCLESFARLNPSWEVRIWTEAESRDWIRREYPSLSDLYSSLCDGGSRNLLFRLAVLEVIGGVAAASGVECLRPLGELLHDGDAWEIAMAPDNPANRGYWDGMALPVDDFVIARPGSRIIGRLLAESVQARAWPSRVQTARRISHHAAEARKSCRPGLLMLPHSRIHPLPDPGLTDSVAMVQVHWSIRGRTWRTDSNPCVANYLNRRDERSALLETYGSLLLQSPADLVRARVERHARRLGMRRHTVAEALARFAGGRDKTLIELGVTRSFVSAGHAGYLSDDAALWAPQAPDSWDWGDGSFSRVAVEALQGIDFTYIGVDPLPQARQITKCMLDGLKGNIGLREEHSGSFLAGLNTPAGLIYMDHGDCGEETARLHAQDARTIVARSLVRGGGLILIDDHGISDRPPISLYSLPVFLNAGFEVISEGYQILLRAP